MGQAEGCRNSNVPLRHPLNLPERASKKYHTYHTSWGKRKRAEDQASPRVPHWCPPLTPPMTPGSIDREARSTGRTWRKEDRHWMDYNKFGWVRRGRRAVSSWWHHGGVWWEHRGGASDQMTWPLGGWRSTQAAPIVQHDPQYVLSQASFAKFGTISALSLVVLFLADYQSTLFSLSSSRIIRRISKDDLKELVIVFDVHF